MFKIVVLPHPVGPITVTVSPSSIDKESLSSASLEPNVLETFWSAIFLAKD
jgi:hypothetical protein